MSKLFHSKRCRESGLGGHISPEIAESLVRHPNRHEVPPLIFEHLVLSGSGILPHDSSISIVSGSPTILANGEAVGDGDGAQDLQHHRLAFGHSPWLREMDDSNCLESQAFSG
jgi:hypothetical protein